MTEIKLNLGENGYKISIGRELLEKAGEILGIKGRVLVVTDSGVPREYAEKVASSFENAKILTVAEGEGSKSFETLQTVLSCMKEMKLTRRDSAIAVGGGVVGDLVGFAASIYMRGIDFYNIPTTLLSQVDSSIGGKCAINFDGVKNIVGSFHQPSGVIIDTDVLATLPKRHIASGLAEAVKMSLTSNNELFEFFEKLNVGEEYKSFEKIIIESLRIKKSVVEEDETEKGVRKILNFGHTFGHGVEAEEGMRGYYHGECVSIGMLPMCSPSVRERLVKVLKKLGLPTEYSGKTGGALTYLSHDKKSLGDSVDVIVVDTVGQCDIVNMTYDEIAKRVKDCYR